MDNWANSSSSTTTSSSSITNNSNVFLKQANKNSHKISKPIRKSLPLPAVDPNPQFPGPGRVPPQHPAVYNINKNDFRDVVQKLTGSPAHDRQHQPPPPPPPITQPRPPNSRLQRIRPPPLSQIGNRPNQIAQIPQLDAGAAETPISAYMRFLQNPPSALLSSGQRPSTFSPRHPPAESPISAYMRFFQNSASPRAPSSMWNGGLRPDSLIPPPFSPRFSQSPGAPRPAEPLTLTGAFPSPYPAMPLSPLPFGCIPSPRSPYGMMSPGFLFAPMGFPQLPPLSPRWKGI